MTQKPLKGALIGFGFIQSKGHLPCYLERKKTLNDVEIVAVADICPERRELAQQLIPEARVYTSGDILIEAEAGNLDFVDIATPPAYHAPLALMALKSGIHVLCEKPLTATLAEAKELLMAAREYQRVIFPCHNYKHAPVVKAIRSILESGRIGKVRSVTLNTFRNTHAKGVPEWKTHWRREKRYSGGGIAMDHGSHTFYLTFDWLGSYPTAVTAKMDNLEPNKYDTEDNFSAVLTFPNGLAHVHLTWTAGVRKVIYTLQGEKGAITVDDDEIQIATQQETTGPDVAQGNVRWNVEKRQVSSHWMDASHVSWFSSLFEQFKQAVYQKDFVGREALEAYRCIELIDACYRSAHSMSAEQTLSNELSHL